jgi:SpoVK/Ycf46/Vps4 family AAA+-type ATPase
MEGNNNNKDKEGENKKKKIIKKIVEKKEKKEEEEKTDEEKEEEKKSEEEVGKRKMEQKDAEKDNSERKRRYRRGSSNNDENSYPPPPPPMNRSDNIFGDDDDMGGFGPVFTILLGGGGGPGGRLSEKFNELKKKEEEEDDFQKYFDEATELHPIDKEIKTLQDLIDLGETYDPLDPKRYVINMRALHKCLQPLKDLQSMIGMKLVKDMILDLIFFRLQNIRDSNGKEELWHTVIQGSPGTGKTEISKMLGKVFYGLGICKKDKFTAVKRSDMIGKYLGHTAKMTQEVFDNAKGGVLFIDEAYALGNPEGRDTFSKECIDTINQNLTENKDTIVFIAGYKEQLEESFFSYNPGLNRRFKFRINVDKYDASDLRLIYIKKVKDDGWEILEDNDEKQVPLDFFTKNREMFKYNGGDMENLWHLTKIAHARRIFGKSNDIKKKITKEDIQKAFEIYLNNDEVKNRKDDMKKYLMETLYC